MKKISKIVIYILENGGLFGCGVLLFCVYVVYVLGSFLFNIFNLNVKDFHIFIACVVIAITLINARAIFSYFLRLWDKAGTFFIGLTLFGLFCVIGSWIEIIKNGMNGEGFLGLVFGLFLIGAVALNQ